MIPMLDVYTTLGSQGSGHARVGRAHFMLRRGSVSTTFRYDDEYLARRDSYAIDPTMPLLVSTYQSEGLPGAFRDSLPDRWGRTLIEKEQQRQFEAFGNTLRNLDDVDYLVGVMDATREGALRFSFPSEQANPTTFLADHGDIPKIISLPELLRASESVARDADTLLELKELLDAGSGSLGGARPKASVIDDGKLLLAKFPHPYDKWDVMAWEKTALDIACAAGVEVPANRLVTIGDTSILLLERFDREGSLLEGRRIPYISAMTLLAANDGESRDYLELIEAVLSFVSDSEAVLGSLFARVCLSVLLHNTDDHLRNIGFVMKDAKWQLAPMFDVNPNPYEASVRATGIMGSYDPSADECTRLRELAEAAGMADDAFNNICEGVCDATSDWRSIARRNGCKMSEINMFAPVIDARLDALCGVR